MALYDDISDHIYAKSQGPFRLCHCSTILLYLISFLNLFDYSRQLFPAVLIFFCDILLLPKITWGLVLRHGVFDGLGEAACLTRLIRILPVHLNEPFRKQISNRLVQAIPWHTYRKQDFLRQTPAFFNETVLVHHLVQFKPKKWHPIMSYS